VVLTKTSFKNTKQCILENNSITVMSGGYFEGYTLIFTVLRLAAGIRWCGLSAEIIFPER